MLPQSGTSSCGHKNLLLCDLILSHIFIPDVYMKCYTLRLNMCLFQILISAHSTIKKVTLFIQWV